MGSTWVSDDGNAVPLDVGIDLTSFSLQNGRFVSPIRKYRCVAIDKLRVMMLRAVITY